MTTEQRSPSWVSSHARKAAKNMRRLFEEARPVRPSAELFSQGQSFRDYLLAEDSFTAPMPGFVDPVPVFLMKDGALGVGFWLSSLAHEMMPEDEIASRLEKLAAALSTASGRGAVRGLSFQVISDVEPDLESVPPAFAREPRTFAQRLARTRFESISDFALEPRCGLRLMRRRLLVTLRLEGAHPLRDAGAEMEDAARVFARRLRALSDAASHLRAGLADAGFAPRELSRDEFLFFLRDSLHSISMRTESPARHLLPSKASRPLAEQALYHALEVTPGGLGVDTDSWQVATLLEAPETTSMGLLAKLLALAVPHRVVVNIRPITPSAGLAFKRMVLAYARDPQGIRQRDDLDEVDSRVSHEETLLAFSWHLLVRTQGARLVDLVDTSSGVEGDLRRALSQVTAQLSAQFREETLCAPLIFAACLPFQNAPALGSLVGREILMLSRNVVSLLPLFGGFAGSPTPMVQMMSRAGERVSLNPRDAQGASHLAVLGGTGGGKSFLTANLIVSFLAAHPEGRVFIIDKKTSYSVLAKLAAEESSASFLKPPGNFPNIFQGGFNPEALPVIVGLLTTAITLLSPKAEISALEVRVLSDAIRMTFEEKERQAGSRFDGESGTIAASHARAIALPRLSEVVANLHPACDALEFSSHIATKLGDLLSPFTGSGPYARFFDSPGVLDLDAKAPLVTLCDLDGVAGDPILMILTVQALIIEILRLVRPKDERTPNPPSLLVVEEVGVLAGESPALVAFIKDAWKTMRKFQVTCVGLTNEVTDFTSKPGPQEIWNVSPNHLILTQNSGSIGVMEENIRAGKNGLVPSLAHCALLRNLKISKGEFADGLWMSDGTQGTYTYVPTGFDYWCAASDPTELATLQDVTDVLRVHVSRPVFEAVSALAVLFPGGARSGTGGNVRPLTPEEKERVTHHAMKARVLSPSVHSEVVPPAPVEVTA